MLAEEQTTEISYLLLKICRAHRHVVSQGLGQLGLHLGQDMLLDQLWDQDGMTQTELSSRLGIQPATVSKMLSRMENTGLVRCCRDTVDGRLSRASLTDEGRELQSAVQTVRSGVEDQVLAQMSAEEQKTLRRLLTQVLENLRQT